ncbi:MAG: 2Fe-2S iron-sulfur cluster binding domain-containing protein [Colwellia sp.]|nr:2Fe-2S iron-sulfur cluster binding domain-containing protein [Colwellia sp.]
MALIKIIHKWLSLLVGLQLLIWLGSGFFFNLMDGEKAHGGQYRIWQQQKSVIEPSQLFDPKLILTQLSKQNIEVISLKQIQLLAKPYYLLTHEKSLYAHFKNNYSLVDAYSGEIVIIDEAMASMLANNSYSGAGEILSAVKLSPPYDDIAREKNNVWQINYSDDNYTSVYVDAGSGRLIAHSNDDKRFADFFFMLHFMDYGNEASFNNIQIIIFAIFTLFFALTGLIWTIELGFNGQYKLSFFFKGKSTLQDIILLDKNQQRINDVNLTRNINLLDALLVHDIALSSSCGGGGTCGQCKIKMSNNNGSQFKVTSADYAQLNDAELEQGYRLACQHTSEGVEQITLLDVTQGKKHQLMLQQSKFISPFIKELRFSLVDESPLSYKAGAFMRFIIPAGKGCSIPLKLPDDLQPHWHHIEHLEYEHLACTRSYSLAETSLNTEELIFTIKIQSAPHNVTLPGVGSSYLCNLEQGELVDAIGPFEEFYAVNNSDKTMVLLGAGSGMAPLKSLIAEQMAVKNSAENSTGKSDETVPRAIHFFYGARTQNDLLYAEYFDDLAEQHDLFNYYPVLSQANEDWTGEKGYIQQTLFQQFDGLGDVGNLEFYLCGPQALMAETITLLKAKGVTDSAIKFDSFGGNNVLLKKQ